MSKPKKDKEKIVTLPLSFEQAVKKALNTPLPKKIKNKTK